MQGICKKVDSTGVVTHVLVRPVQGAPFEMSVEEYVDQAISPPVAQLPVCGD